MKFTKCLLPLMIWMSFVEKVEVLEPITTGVAAVTAIAGSALLANFDTLKCQVYECCNDEWTKPNLTGLADSLKKQLHGQHLVTKTTVNAIRGHLSNPNPQKALVLSFHGCTGCGKNFVSKIIVEHLFHRKVESKFYHLFVSTLHFPHDSLIDQYKDQLRDWIRGNVSFCARSVFVFDEMDKMPAGLIDTIKPYIDHYPEINGVDYRKSIFIFLTNTGSRDITKATLNNWKLGRMRTDIQLKDMEQIITLGAFNEQGGLWHSSLIEKDLITAFIPFLPMERVHVKLCIRDYLLMKGKQVTGEVIGKVADLLTYYPSDYNLFSTSGCKRVSQKVDLVIEEILNP